MAWSPDNLRTLGAKATFHQALDNIPTFYQNHCQEETSTTNQETYSFPGFLPSPRRFLDSRQFQGMLDFTFNLANYEYELSMIINRTHWEDDQTNLIRQRLTEMAECWGTYKDSLFSALLAAGNVSGSNGFDGVTFHSDDHSSGTLGATNDNNLANTTEGDTILSATTFLQCIEEARRTFLGYADDTGRPYNQLAVQKLRAVIHPNQERAAVESMNATMVGSSGGQTSVIGGMFLDGYDVNPYQASGDSDEIYFSAVGASRMPFIFQKRSELEVVVLDDVASVADNNGVKVLTRQRFRFGYGDPRRSILMTVS